MLNKVFPSIIAHLIHLCAPSAKPHIIKHGNVKRRKRRKNVIIVVVNPIIHVPNILIIQRNLIFGKNLAIRSRARL